MNSVINYQHFKPGSREQNVVLLVDQDSDARYCIRESLSDKFVIHESENCEDAWAKVMNITPNVIIADYTTLHVTEGNLCLELKKDEAYSDIPLVVTGPSSIETKMKCLRAGADEYLSVPFFAAELQIRISNLINTRKRIEDKFSRNLDIKTKVMSANETFLKRSMEIIEANICQTQFGIVPFAKELGMSQAQLYRKMISAAGVSPNDFVRHYRLKRAAELLEQKTGNVSEVAFQVGFNSLSYFSKCFRDKFGTTPLDFQKRAVVQD